MFLIQICIKKCGNDMNHRRTQKNSAWTCFLHKHALNSGKQIEIEIENKIGIEGNALANEDSVLEARHS